MANLLPLQDPAWNYREIVKQLLLLEDHLFHPRKRCSDCITKHFLTAEALAEEALTLSDSFEYTKMCIELPERIRQLQLVGVKGRHTQIAQKVRQIRKALCQLYSTVHASSISRVASLKLR